MRRLLTVSVMLLGGFAAVRSPAANTYMQFQSSFNTNDEFVTVNKPKSKNFGGEFAGFGVRVAANTGGVTLGRFSHWGNQPAELGAKVKANSASNSNNRAQATILSGNIGYAPEFGITLSCISPGSCEYSVSPTFGTLPVGDGMEADLFGSYCISSSTCSPNTSTTYGQSMNTVSDTQYFCYKTTSYEYYDYVNSGADAFSLSGSGAVTCRYCDCPY